MRKTKIIATLGPATDQPGVLEEIISAGVNILRFNMSHSDHATHAQRMQQVRGLREKLKLPIAALLDTKGPEIRTGLFPHPVTLSEGQQFTLTTRTAEGSEKGCSVTYAGLPGDIRPGCRVLIDDGLVELRVESVADTDIICTVVNGGTVTSSKGINCPEVHFSMPYLSEKDKSDLAFGKEQDFDYIAASFVRNADDIHVLRAELERIGWTDVRVIAKIENAEGVARMDEIIEAADGIMIARGDMGVEVAIEELPVIQKELIKRTVSQGKQVITATQMLESMIHNTLPTRAEVNDVANAIYDGTSAIMLSGETAAGKHPVESVKMMSRIALRTESDIDYGKRFHNLPIEICGEITTAISHATVMTAHELEAATIVTVTESGFTARMVSRYRPICPVIAGTPNEKVWRQLNLLFGVQPRLIDEKYNTDQLLAEAVELARTSGLAGEGDRIVITAGVPLGETGTTNLLKVQEL
ncbi:MAG: pyruvate kinase [Ruminococcaceae bacterium]|nr:pyruvate kinase [Oscillospiraceae bacterium]